MSGQCYGCGSEFGFLRKEKGCKNCGFAFCSKCVSKKAAVPKEKLSAKDSQKDTHHVCNRCYNVLTGKVPAEDSGRQSPPEAYKKRMAALEQKEAQVTTQGKQPTAGAGRPNPKYAALDKPDRDIAERLDKLKAKPKEQKASDKDINERLARLKGEDPAIRTAPTKPFYQPPDRRTQVEQIDDLLEEIANEVEIDSHQPDPATYVEDGLAKLREDQSGTKPDLQNNLDKENLPSPKNFVKNIDVEAGASKKTEGQGQPGQEGDVDFAEVQALMTKAAAQMEVDAQRALEDMQKDKELMDRLSEIKKRQKDKDGKPVESSVDKAEQQEEEEDSEDEEVAARRIMQQFLEEVKLDDRLGEDPAVNTDTSRSAKPDNRTSRSAKPDNRTGGASAKPDRSNSKQDNQAKSSKNEETEDDDYEDPDELPYCCICTEDAVTRCIDCDMDLYCNRCFREGHKELGLTDHRSVPYKAPKGYR